MSPFKKTKYVVTRTYSASAHMNGYTHLLFRPAQVQLEGDRTRLRRDVTRVRVLRTLVDALSKPTELTQATNVCTVLSLIGHNPSLLAFHLTLDARCPEGNDR